MGGSQESPFCSQVLHMYMGKETQDIPVFCPVTQLAGDPEVCEASCSLPSPSALSTY